MSSTLLYKHDESSTMLYWIQEERRTSKYFKCSKLVLFDNVSWFYFQSFRGEITMSIPVSNFMKKYSEEPCKKNPKYFV